MSNTVNILILNGAQDRNRTGTVLLPRDFKSRATKPIINDFNILRRPQHSQVPLFNPSYRTFCSTAASGKSAAMVARYDRKKKRVEATE